MAQLDPGPLIADLEGIELGSLDKEVLKHPKLGGVILFSRNFESREQLQGLVRCIREIRPELVLCVDQEGGRVQRFKEGFTRLPPMGTIRQIAAETGYTLADSYISGAQSLAADLGYLMASELAAMDIDHSFTPVLDLDRDKSRVIGDRAFSDDPTETVELASAFIDGMTAAGMAATAKHFPGHGGVVEDSHLELPRDRRPYSDILQRDLVPFQQLKDQYVAVMTAHIVFEDIDTQPVSFSKRWLSDILREDIGFSGLVVSDDLSMKGAAECGDFKDRSRAALEAGCDLILLCNQRREAEFVLEFLEAEQLGKNGIANALKRKKQVVSSSVNEQMSRLKRVIESYV